MSDIMRQVGEFVPDKLIAGNQLPALTRAVTLASGEGVLTRGTLISIDGDVANVVSGTADAVDGILCDNVTLSADGTTDALIYITGEFLGTEVTVGADATVDDFTRELRKLGIIIR